MKSVCIKSVGLGLDCVPFHGGWELVEWKPTLTLSEVIEMEFDQTCAEIEEEERVELGISKLVEICDKIEIEGPCEFVGPQIELDLGEGSSIFEDEPAVEVPREVPTVVVDEEDSSVEFVVSGKETKADQAEGVGVEPVPEDAQINLGGMGVGIGEPVPGDDRSGETPDLMEVDPAVRTGSGPIREEVAGAGFEQGVILGVPSTGFDLYVRENKSLLGRDRLLELSQHLSQQPGLRSLQSVKKGLWFPPHQGV